MIISQIPGLFNALCVLALSLGTLSIKFDRKLLKVNVRSDPRTRFFSAVRLCISLGVALTLSIQCVLLKGHNSSIESPIQWLTLICLFVTQANFYQLSLKSGVVEKFFNGLFQLDSVLPEEIKCDQNSLRTKIDIAFVICQLITAILLPVGFVYGLHWKNPCKPTLAGCFLITTCLSGTSINHRLHDTIDLITNYAVYILNHWMWSISLHGGVFGVAGFQTLGVRGIYQFIQRYKNHHNCLPKLSFK